MAHFAKVVDEIVVTVIVAEADFIATLEDANSWIQTSYNTRGGIHYMPNSITPSDDQSKALRKNYAGIGYTYDSERDAFIPPKPYPSWLLDETTCLWIAPKAKPSDNKMYKWNEELLNWVVYIMGQ